MNDDLPPDESAGEPPADSTNETDGDGRDERVALLLEVPPLDEVTRRRLVTRALAGTEHRRARARRLLVPAAAALVAFALIGVGAFVVATRGGGDGGTAARSTTAAPDTQRGAPQAGEAGTSHAGVPDLGDLGDLTDEDELRQRLAVARRDPTPIARGAPPACLDRALRGTPTPEAFGTGTDGGRSVLVLVLPGRSDSTTAVLLDQETCRAVSVVNLS